MMLEIKQIPVLNDNYIYLVHDTESLQTLVVDPAESAPVLETLATYGWTLNTILITHHHSDHIHGNKVLKAVTGCKIIGSKTDVHRIPEIDVAVTEPDVLYLGKHPIHVISCDGHTHGHICFYFPTTQDLFCGDTLFAMGCGRLLEGSASEMWQSLCKLRALDMDTKCYCAHEYTLANGNFALTLEPNNLNLQQRVVYVKQQREHGVSTMPFLLADELNTNPFLRADLESFKHELGMATIPAPEVFRQLRQQKDCF